MLQGFGPGPIMPPHFEPFGATLSPMTNSQMMPQPFPGFSTISEPGMTAATSQASL